jgi:adenine phosphoribosyltransferase
MEFNLDKHIRKTPDFPKEGILFYDITSLVASVEARNFIKKRMIELYENKPITKLIAVESRGFLFAPLLADALGLPIILARKKGKLPNECFEMEYTLEYGKSSIEIQRLDLCEKDNVLIVDDLVATGGTLEAIGKIVEKDAGAKVEGIFCVIGLPFLQYEKKLSYNISTLINYHGE